MSPLNRLYLLRNFAFIRSKKNTTTPEYKFNFSVTTMQTHGQNQQNCQIKSQTYFLKSHPANPHLKRVFCKESKIKHYEVNGSIVFKTKSQPKLFQDKVRNLQIGSSQSKSDRYNIFKKILQMVAKTFGLGCLLYMMTGKKDLMLAETSNIERQIIIAKRIQNKISQSEKQYQGLYQIVYLWVLSGIIPIGWRLISMLFFEQVSWTGLVLRLLWMTLQNLSIYLIVKNLKLQQKLFQEVALLARIQLNYDQYEKIKQNK